MKSKLSHYPYNRPQYEWEKKHLEETFGEYYSKYKAEEKTEEGHYSIRKATEEEKSQTNKVMMPGKLFTYRIEDNYQWPAKKMPNVYSGYYEDNTITDIEGGASYSDWFNYTENFTREYVYIDENWTYKSSSMPIKDKILEDLTLWESNHYNTYGKVIKYSIDEVGYTYRGNFNKPYGASKISINAHCDDGKVYEAYTFSLGNLNIPEDYSSGEYYEFRAKDGFGLINNTLYGLEEITTDIQGEPEPRPEGYYYLRRKKDYTLREFTTKEEVSVHNLKVLRFANEDERIDITDFWHDHTTGIHGYLVNNNIQFYTKNDTTAYAIDNDISYISYHYWDKATDEFLTQNGYLASDGYNLYFIREHTFKHQDKAINVLNDRWSRNYMEDATNGSILTEYNITYGDYQMYSYAPIIEWHPPYGERYATLSNYKGRYTINKLYDNLYYFKFLDGGIIKHPNSPEKYPSAITELVCEYKDGVYYYNGITTFDITKTDSPWGDMYPLLRPFSFTNPKYWGDKTITYDGILLGRPEAKYAFDGMLWYPYSGHSSSYIHQTKYEIPGLPETVEEPLIIPDELVNILEEQGIVLADGTADYIVDTSKIYYHYDDITKNVFDKESDYIDLDNIKLFTGYVPESRTYWLHEHNKEYDCVLPDNPGSIIKDNYYYEHNLGITDYQYIVYKDDELVLSETSQNELSIIPYKPNGEIYYLNGKKYNKTTEYLCDLLSVYKAEIGGCDRRTYFPTSHNYNAFTNNYTTEAITRILPDGSQGPTIFVNTNGMGFIECIVEQKNNWVEVNTVSDALNSNGFIIKDNAFYINCADEAIREQYAIWEKYRGDKKGQEVDVGVYSYSELPKIYQDDLTTEIFTTQRNNGWLKIGWIEDNKFYTYGYSELSPNVSLDKYLIGLANYGIYYTELERIVDNGKVSPREFNYKVGKYLELDSEYIYNDNLNYLPHEDTYDYDNLTLTTYKDLAFIIKNQLEIGEKDLLNNVSYTKTINDGDSIDFTTIASASITAQLNYRVEEANKLVGQNFTYLLDYGDGEWHNMGLFTIDEAESIDAYTSRITGHDHMYRLNKYVDDFIAKYKYPTTLGKFWKDLLDYCDIFYEDDTIEGVNADLVLNRNFEAVKTTGLQIAEYISQLMAGYAHIDKDRFSAKIGHYNKKPLIIMPSNYTDLNMSSYSAEIMNQVRLGFNNDKSVIYSGPTTENSVPYYITDNSLIIYNITDEEGYEILRNIMNVIDALPVDYNKAEMKMLTPIVNNEIKVGDIIEVESKLGKRIKMMVMEISIDGSGITYKSFGEAQYPVEGENISSQIIYLNDLQNQVNNIRGDGQETKQELVQISATQTELVNAVNGLHEETIDLGANLVAVDEKYQEITNQITSDHDQDIVNVIDKIDAHKSTTSNGLASIQLSNKLDDVVLKSFLTGFTKALVSDGKFSIMLDENTYINFQIDEDKNELFVSIANGAGNLKHIIIKGA